MCVIMGSRFILMSFLPSEKQQLPIKYELIKKKKLLKKTAGQNNILLL